MCAIGEKNKPLPITFVIFPVADVGIEVKCLLDTESILLIGFVQLTQIDGIDLMDDAHLFLFFHLFNVKLL